MKPFKSFLAPQIDRYTRYRHNLGYGMETSLFHLKTFDRYLVEKQVKSGLLTPAFFLQFRSDLKMEARSANRVISSVRVFFKFLVRQGIYRENPLKDVPFIAENDIVPYVFSPEQIDQLLQSVCQKIHKSPRRYLKDLSKYMAITLIARCGLRISEPLRLMHHHYRKDEKTLYIEKTKFKKDRLIPVPMAVATELENYLAVRDVLLENYRIPYLFVGVNRAKINPEMISRVFYQAVEGIGIARQRQVIGNKNFNAPTVHSLRHSFAVNTLMRIKKSGKSAQHALPILAAYMGHSEYKHTIKYLKVVNAKHHRQLLSFMRSQKWNI
jgi:site-specific recombinase XerD